MRLEFGEKVQTSDDQEAGTIDRLVFTPEHAVVKTVVLHRGALLGHLVEVPFNTLESTTDGALHLAYTADQMRELPEFYEEGYTTQPPVDYSTPPGEPLTWPLGAGLAQPPFPLGATVPSQPAGEAVLDSATRKEIEEAWRQQDVQNVVIGNSSTVKSRDGEHVGTVHGFIVDPISGQATRIVVRSGFPVSKDFELPAEQIAHVDDNVVDLTVTATEVSR